MLVAVWVGDIADGAVLSIDVLTYEIHWDPRQMEAVISKPRTRPGPIDFRVGSANGHHLAYVGGSSSPASTTHPAVMGCRSSRGGSHLAQSSHT
jgi:hypothetical protein